MLPLDHLLNGEEHPRVTVGLELEPAAAGDPAATTDSAIQGRSLRQIAWRRLKRDKLAMAGLYFLIFLVLVAVFAPLIVKLLGDPPAEFHENLVDIQGGTMLPYGNMGGI